MFKFKGKKVETSMLIAIFLGINLLLMIYVAFFKRDALRLETLKVGGPENMSLVTKLYESDQNKQQNKASIEQALASLNWAQAPTAQPTQDTTAAAPTATAGDAAKFAAIEKDGYIKGNKNARITVIEYSDLLCPFCKRHFAAQTVENLLTKYPNDVNMEFRQMPLPQLHPTAPIWAQGAVCVGKLAGGDKFYAYIAEAFKASEFTESSVTDIAVKLGVNKAKFTSCLTSPETLATVAAQQQEGNGFGVNGTPGNVIVDNQKGTFQLLAGAYPSADFEKIIDGILGK